MKHDTLTEVIRSLFGAGAVLLHRPIFEGDERERLVACIDSNFVSSVGAKVIEFERRVADFSGAAHAVATVNGTTALQVALQVAGVGPGDEVITQPLTFIATCNAISHVGARPVFVDVDEDTMGLSPAALLSFLRQEAEQRTDGCFNRRTGRRLAACLPMHTLGLISRIEEAAAICAEWNIPLVEDAAEALGSKSFGRHAGTFGKLGVFSFNGNKIITTGGGGMIITDDEALAKRAKHLTTTAKVPHAYEFVHDEVGYNYRLPNLNAALGCAQMARLPEMLNAKAAVGDAYRRFFAGRSPRFIEPRAGIQWNHWLCSILMNNRSERDALLRALNTEGIQARPLWTLMTDLPMYAACQSDDGATARYLVDRVVSLPSSVPDGALSRS
jgi:aminotransferase in exopolysaccharide biosynthesis